MLQIIFKKGDTLMEKDIYAPDWVVSSDYAMYPSEEHKKWMDEFGKKSMKQVCEDIKAGRG